VQIDFEKLAQRAGFKNAQSARACWRPAWNKLKAMGAAVDNTASAPAAAPAPNTPGKSTTTTPTGKPKATPGSKRKASTAKKSSASVKIEEDGDSDASFGGGMAETPSKRVKRTAKATKGKSKALADLMSMGMAEDWGALPGELGKVQVDSDDDSGGGINEIPVKRLPKMFKAKTATKSTVEHSQAMSGKKTTGTSGMAQFDSDDETGGGGLKAIPPFQPSQAKDTSTMFDMADFIHEDKLDEGSEL